MNVELKEWRSDCKFCCGAGAALAAGATDPHQRRAGIFHDAAHIGEVKINDARDGDDIADALNCLSKHVIRDAERIFHGCLAADDAEESLVWDDDHGVDVLAQLFRGGVRHGGPALPFKLKRLGDDADRQRAQIFRNLRHNRRGARARATSHTGGHEDEVGSIKCGAKILKVFLSGALANDRVAASAEATGDRITNSDAGGGVGFHERLSVGVHRDELNAEEFSTNHAIDGVGAGTTDSDHADQRKVLRLRSHRPLPSAQLPNVDPHVRSPPQCADRPPVGSWKCSSAAGYVEEGPQVGVPLTASAGEEALDRSADSADETRLGLFGDPRLIQTARDPGEEAEDRGV